MMKRLIIGDTRERILSTLEVILKHWGYRVLVSSKTEHLKALLQETSPDLLFMGAPLLHPGENSVVDEVRTLTKKTSCPLVVLANGEFPSLDFPHETLDVPIDLFELYARIQKYLEKTPRKNLRLSLKLPGVLYRDGASHLSEILSLSEQGLFIRTGFRLAKEDKLSVIFPLMGMKKELEIEGKVLYSVLPSPENNYLQGSGVEFLPLSPENKHFLQTFIETCFLGELTPMERARMDLTDDQIQSLSHEITLKLISTR